MAPVVKNQADIAGDINDMDSVPSLGRYLGGGHGNPIKTNPMEEGHSP